MRKLVILTLLLAAGFTAYPQSSSRSRESNNRSSSTVSRSSKSNSGSATKSSSSSSSRTKATKSDAGSSSRQAATRSSSSGPTRSAATQSRSSNSSSRSNAVKAGSSSDRSDRSSAVQSRSSSENRSNSVQSRSSSASRSAEYGRSQSAARSSNDREGVSRSNSAVRVKTESSADRGQVRSSSGSEGIRARSESSDSYSRTAHQGTRIYERSDGTKYRHQNDEVFATRNYRVDYKSSDELRRSDEFRRYYRDYERWNSVRYRRPVVYHYHIHPPLSIEVRRVRYPYRAPVHLDLCWTPWLHYRFMYYYPMHNNWNVDYGHYIETISTYEAMNYAGSVKRVYGRVEEVYYSDADDTYTLYFGAEFPYHDFSVVIPRRVAKDIAWSPSWYFENEYVWVVGLIDVWEGKPEMVIHDEDQIKRY